MWRPDDEDEYASFGRYGTLGVAILRSPLDVRFFERLDRLMQSLSDEGRFSILLVRAGETPGQMGAQLRTQAKAILKRHAPQLIGFGYVLAGRGLKAKLLRGAINTVMLGASFPAKTFTDLPASVDWLVGLPDAPAELRTGRGELLSTLQRLSA